MSDTLLSPTDLLRLLTQRCSRKDVRNFCLALGIDYGGIPGDTTSAKLSSLIQQYHNHNQMEELAAAITRVRPDLKRDVYLQTSEPKSSPSVASAEKDPTQPVDQTRHIASDQPDPDTSSSPVRIWEKVIVPILVATIAIIGPIVVALINNHNQQTLPATSPTAIAGQLTSSPTPSAISIVLPSSTTAGVPLLLPTPSSGVVLADFIQLAPQARRCIGNQCVPFPAQNDVTISGQDLNVSLKPRNSVSISVEYPQTNDTFQVGYNEFFTAIVVPPQAPGNITVSVELVPNDNIVPITYPPLYTAPLPNNGHPVLIEFPILQSRVGYPDKNFLSGKNLQFKLVVQSDSLSANRIFIWRNPQIRKP